MKQRQSAVGRLTQPLRTLAQRFAFGFFVLASVALLLAGRADPALFERARVGVVDFTAPILDAASRPVETARDLVAQGRALLDLRAENARLKAENDRLLAWLEAARRLQAENAQLRALLAFKPAGARRYAAGRVIGSTGPFLRNVIVAVGARDGVVKGQAAVVGEGLVGRVAAVGQRSARVLLITDLNSRIPVMVESTRDRALLAGDNERTAKLVYLGTVSGVEPGDRVVTSGHGDAFPPGIPVGVVETVAEQGVRVRPFADLERLDYVRIVDYGLDGVLRAPMADAGAPAGPPAAGP